MGGRISKEKSLVLIGPMGHGKSTTGNNLCGANCFTTGEDVTSVTQEIKFKTIKNLTVVDCPGFGDAQNENLFLKKFLEKKEEMLDACPIDAFVLVIKFDGRESRPFLPTAQQFVKCFGSVAITSLIILCIQSNRWKKYTDNEFEYIIKNSDGYRYLKNKNAWIPVQYCLWENIGREYANQREKFEQCQKRVQPFTYTKMRSAIDMIEEKLGARSGGNSFRYRTTSNQNSEICTII